MWNAAENARAEALGSFPSSPAEGAAAAPSSLPGGNGRKVAKLR
jgi:hypothetical protein